jgi:hypothetical protein
VVLGCVGKWRSSRRLLNRRLRRLCGWCLSCGLFFEAAWLPTDCNPGDAPTRCYSIADWYGEVPDIYGRTLPQAMPTDNVTHELRLLTDELPDVLEPAYIANISSFDVGGDFSTVGCLHHFVRSAGATHRPGAPTHHTEALIQHCLPTSTTTNMQYDSNSTSPILCPHIDPSPSCSIPKQFRRENANLSERKKPVSTQKRKTQLRCIVRAQQGA